MHRLSRVEAHRVSAILQETLEKLSFLETITPDVLQHRDELSQIVGDKISQIIQEQRDLEMKYETLVAERSQLKGLANKSKFKENQRQIQEVSRQLRESTKNLCRNLKSNPNVGGNLVKIQTERQALVDLLSRTIEELQDGSFVTLVTRVTEDKRAQDKVHDVIQKEKEASNTVKRLDQELTQAKAEHQREVVEQKEAIATLKENLLQLKSKSQVDLAYARREAKAKTSSTDRMYSQIVKDHEKAINELQKKCDNEEMVHAESKEFLEMQYQKLTKQVEEWNVKFQTEYESKEAELQKLTDDRNANLVQLEALRKRWDDEQAGKRAKIEEKKRLIELEKLRKEETIRQNAAAATIQTQFRLHAKETKAAKSTSDKKGKKGKKGKGKKK